MFIIDLHISTFIVLYAVIVLNAFICTRKKKKQRFKFVRGGCGQNSGLL